MSPSALIQYLLLSKNRINNFNSALLIFGYKELGSDPELFLINSSLTTKENAFLSTELRSDNFALSIVRTLAQAPTTVSSENKIKREIEFTRKVFDIR